MHYMADSIVWSLFTLIKCCFVSFPDLGLACPEPFPNASYDGFASANGAQHVIVRQHPHAVTQ